MDWVRDAPGLHSWDLDRVFRYEPKSTDILRIKDDKAFLWSIETHEEWAKWIKLNCPSPKDSRSTSVVIFARRSGDSTQDQARKTRAENWLDGMEIELPVRPGATQGSVLLGLGTDSQNDERRSKPSSSMRRGLRTMPFSRKTFEMIIKAFYMHGSISRAISRSDIPVFSHTGAVMEDENGKKHEASIFNCRTSNAWPMDIASTVTYFPHCDLKFNVVFGCDLSVEEEILNRLILARNDTCHPLLLPGIIAETERRRHVQIVDDIVDEVEARIFQLEVAPDSQNSMTTIQMEKLHKDKRSAWLNIAYIRNCLISWQKQLEKIAIQVDELDHLLLAWPRSSSNLNTPFFHTADGRSLMSEERKATDLKQARTTYLDTKSPEPYCTQFGDRYLATGYKIKSRILDIIEEYDKIRDCSMRIDGMAMATQWAQGETSLEIAKATSRDSKHMRSIALVTMVFLPGTFFAGVFSMTFFNWSDDSGQPAISGYIWIYIVITTVFTLLTLVLWYYFNLYRRQAPRNKPLAV